MAVNADCPACRGFKTLWSRDYPVHRWSCTNRGCETYPHDWVLPPVVAGSVCLASALRGIGRYLEEAELKATEDTP